MYKSTLQRGATHLARLEWLALTGLAGFYAIKTADGSDRGVLVSSFLEVLPEGAFATYGPFLAGLLVVLAVGLGFVPIWRAMDGGPPWYAIPIAFLVALPTAVAWVLIVGVLLLARGGYVGPLEGGLSILLLAIAVVVGRFTIPVSTGAAAGARRLLGWSR